MKEHRRFNRADFHTTGFFSIDGKETHFRIINISLNGILLEPEFDTQPEFGIEVPMTIELSSSDIKIKMTAVLLHMEEHHLGFRFKKIDVESMIHLRRLVELNSDSADQIANELHFLRKD